MFDDLRKLLSPPDRKILFVGIGNVLKQDDGAGVYISNRIKHTSRITALSAEMSVENYIGKINSLRPDTVIFIDCMEMNSPPGTARLFRVEEIQDLTFNTHNISLKRIGDFFTMPVYVLGIQPEKIDFGENISYLVHDVAEKIIKFINKQEV